VCDKALKGQQILQEEEEAAKALAALSEFLEANVDRCLDSSISKKAAATKKFAAVTKKPAMKKMAPSEKTDQIVVSM